MAMPIVECFDVEVIVDMSCLQSGLKVFIYLQFDSKNIRKLGISHLFGQALAFLDKLGRVILTT